MNQHARRISACGALASLLFITADVTAQVSHRAETLLAGGPDTWYVTSHQGGVIATNGAQTWSWDTSGSGNWALTSAPSFSIPFNAVPVAATRAGNAVLWDGSTLNEFDGTQWNVVATTGAPTAVGAARIVGLRNGDLLLFGGYDAAVTPLNETWVLDGVTDVWSQVTTPASPTPRFDMAMGVMSSTDTVVIFGGDSGGTLLGDTWEFDGVTWTQTATGGPPARAGGALGFRPSTNDLTLIGGYPPLGPPLQDAWRYDGAWTQIPSSMPGADLSRCRSAGHDVATDELIFSGRASTDFTVVAAVSEFASVGSGCVCDGRTNPFTLGVNGSATLGSSFTLTFSDYTIANPLFIGFDSAAATPPFQFPLLPAGCDQNIATIAGSLLVDISPVQSPAPTLTVPVPTSTTLINSSTVMQGVQLNFSPFNGCSSNAISARIGRW